MFQFVLSVIPSDRTKRQSSLPPPPSLSCHRVIVHIGKISQVPFSRLNNPSSLSLSSHVRHPNLLLLLSLCWTCSSLSMFLCNVQPRTGHSTTDTVSPVLRKGEGSPPSSHWQCFVWNSVQYVVGLLCDKGVLLAYDQFVTHRTSSISSRSPAPPP